MPEPTPGQCCYEAYWQRLCQQYPRVRTPWLAWGLLVATERAAWEAAAQAVLAAPPAVPTLTPEQAMDELRRLVGKYYTGVDVDAFMAAIRGEGEASG